MSGHRVLLIGGTGMIGGLALRLCIERRDVDLVTVIGRRPTGVTHPKVVEILHPDLLDYTGIRDAMTGHDVALFCLGAYTGAVPDQEFRRITVDYTVAFAEALYAGSPVAAVCFLSGQGADRSEKSRVAFARYKGAAEKALLATGLGRVHIFRPGYIYPVESRREPNIAYRVFRLVYPIVRLVYPNIGITSHDLAWAMVEVGIRGTPGHDGPVLENRTIRMLARDR